MSGSTSKYVVPREDNTFLVSPRPPDWGHVLKRNAERIAGYPDWILHVRRTARSEALCFSDNVPNASPLILGGHQPDLFHPGVWFKNFVLNRLATTLRCLSLHVQIDHDVVREVELAFPTLRSGRLTLSTQRLPTNHDGAFLPWENTRCSRLLEEQWVEGLDRVVKELNHFGIQPILQTRLGECRGLLKECKTFSEVTSQLRQIIEKDAGLVNNEVPMSRLAKGGAFAEFVFRCFDKGEKLLQVYNTSRDTFRAERSITNPGQPVPELRRAGEWIETPFWIYHTTEAAEALIAHSHYRHPAWIRVTAHAVEVANAPSESASIRLQCDRRLSVWSQQYQIWSEHGVCIRPRALMTTLFLRLFVGDLFVHGIGGGIYDELTDLIASRFWDIQMPEFVVASASLHLPFGRDTIPSIEPLEGQSTEDLERLARQIRSAPESLLDTSESSQRAQKEAFGNLLQQQPPKGQRKSWHWEMRELRVRIRKSISPVADRLERQSLELIERARVGTIVRSREFSFALFPENPTISRLQALAEHSVCTECSSRESGGKMKDGETSTLAVKEC
ncbi:MAG: hypothetical protein ACK5PB_19455 [Pirellula sp.]